MKSLINNLGENLCFIYSLPRSGSTILSAILGNHPDILCPPEPWLLLKLNNITRSGDINSRFDDDLATIGTNDFISEEDHIIGMRHYANAIYHAKLELQHKKIFIDKTPRYYHIIRTIDTIFPKAKFIGLFRNPLDVAASYKGSWKISIDNLIGNVMSPNSYDFSTGLFILKDYFSKTQNNNKFFIRYEDLCLSPECTIKKICKFLEIKYLPYMIDFNLNTEQMNNYRSAKMGDKNIINTTKIHGKSIGSWKEILSNEEILKFIQFLGKEIFVQLGYKDTVSEVEGRGCLFISENKSKAMRDIITEKVLDFYSSTENNNKMKELVNYLSKLQYQIEVKDKGITYLKDQIMNKDKAITYLKELIAEKEKELIKIKQLPESDIRGVLPKP